MAWVVTAVTTAIEVGTVAAVATAVAEVGLAMTVVGTVTKSKELISVGKVLSVAGGVVSLGANLANLATTGATEAGKDALAGSAGGATNTALDEATKTALTNQAATEGTTAVANQAIGTNLADVAPNLAQNASYGIEGLSGDVGANLVGESGAASSIADQASNALNSVAPSSVSDAAQAAAPAFATDVNAAKNATQAAGLVQSVAPQANTGMLANVENWWNKQTPQVKSALIQGGLGALGGLSQAWSAEQRLALDKKIADERSKEFQTSQSNANAVPTIQFKPVGLVGKTIGGK